MDRIDPQVHHRKFLCHCGCGVCRSMTAPSSRLAFLRACVCGSGTHPITVVTESACSRTALIRIGLIIFCINSCRAPFLRSSNPEYHGDSTEAWPFADPPLLQ